jgi:hypothetical protein
MSKPKEPETRYKKPETRSKVNHTSYNLDTFWFGNAVIRTSKGIYVTKNFEKNKIIAEIETATE